MVFMNRWDIDEALARARPGSLQRVAAQILRDHADMADANSDGWCYWPAPCRAAKLLQLFVEAPDSADRTKRGRELAKALAPVRAFYTRHPQLPRPASLSWRD